MRLNNITSEPITRMISKAILGVIGQLRGNSLKALSARGVMTLGIGTVAGRGTRFVRNMILARILAPDEFGLMAIIMVASMAFEAFTEVGVRQSVIQNKRGADPVYLNVAWWMQAVRGLGLFVIARLVAPWISSFYDKPELLKLLQVCFLAILFRGFFSPRVYVLEKQLRFGRVVFLIESSAILGTIITIGLAFAIRNVWALVIGFVAEAAILCLLSHILVPFLPRFRIDKNCLGELMKFARGMFGLPVLILVSFQADVLVLGKVVPSEQLGVYYLAVALAYLPIGLFSRIISPVLLSAFVQRQDDKKSLCQAVLQITRGAAIFSVPLVTFMATCASGILLLTYGPKYAAAALPFGILSVSVLFRIQKNILGMIYLAIGKPHLHRRFALILSATIVITIYPGVKFFGLRGAAMALLFANFLTFCAQVIGAQRQIGFRFGHYASCWLPGVGLSTVLLLLVGILRWSGITSCKVETMVVALGLFVSYLLYFILRSSRKNAMRTLQGY